MKRLCKPEEVAEVAAWLALESPLYLTGTTIVLDGGLGSL
jgi:NAD(P)-dependent dehydrogenase (short-subunit alcohol dehydrogenase family)